MTEIYDDVIIKNFSFDVDGKNINITLRLTERDLRRGLNEINKRKTKEREIDNKAPFEIFVKRLKKAISARKSKGMTKREISRDVGRLHIDEMDRALQMLVEDGQLKYVMLGGTRGRKRYCFISSDIYSEYSHQIIDSESEK